MYDKMANKYVPTISGLGMHVEVRDPDDKVIMSRVRSCTSASYLNVVLCTSSSKWQNGIG